MVSILKMMFSKHSILAYLFTDQGRQFASADFWEFVSLFKILHSTPTYTQSNDGLTESMVKILKQIISRDDQAGEDAHLAMLAYRVTLRGPGKLSPAEAMTQCKFTALLLIKQHLSTQLNTSREIMLQQRQRQAVHYDCKA